MFKLRSLLPLRSLARNFARIRYYSHEIDEQLTVNNGGVSDFRDKDHYFSENPAIKNQSISIVSNFCAMVLNKQLDANRLTEIDEFRRECESLCDQIGYISDSRLIGFLQTLLMTNIDNNTKLVTVVENEVLWRAKKLPFKLLLKCLNYHSRYQRTDQQKKVVNELIFHIQARLDYAQDVDDIIHLLRLSKYFKSDCVPIIEKTALQMIENVNYNISAQSLCYLLVLLSQFRRRPKPLIQAIVKELIEVPLKDGITDENESEKLSHLINTVIALKSLNITNKNLLQKICDTLCDRNFFDKVSPVSRRDLLTTIGLLNYCHPRILDCFIEKIANNFKCLSEQELSTLVFTAARLYYKPDRFKEVLSSIIVQNINLKNIDTYAWLTYVWSLAILENASSVLISSVLNEEFCDKLLAEKNNFEKTISKLKLLNIKAVAEIEMGLEIDAPKCLMTGLEMPKRQHDVELLRTSVLDAFNSFIPKNIYMATNVITPFGFTIDAEFIIDSSLNPLKLSEYGILGANVNNNYNLKEVPNGYKRVAVLCFGYNDTLLDSNQLIGTKQLIVRILEKLNYSVLIVNQNNFLSNISYDKSILNSKTLITDLFGRN